MERRRRPRDDLVTTLVTSEVDGRRLSASEYCNFWLLLVVAGNETARNALAGGVHALLDHTAELDRLVTNPALIPTAADEILRFVTPIMQFRRTATRDVDVGGHRVGHGDKVVLFYVAANRDGKVFDDPHRFDVGRAPNPHLAFGTGPHFCLGAHLARLEIATVLEELLPHLRRLRLAGPVRRLRSNFMNGVKSMPASLT